MKILSLFAFVFIILALVIIAKTPPASGYELSIYDAYPWYFWVFFVGAIFLAALVIFLQILNEEKSNFWILGFFIILIGNFILLLLPLFRGYSFYGGAGADLFSHVGYMKNISASGHLHEKNLYPIIHIFIVNISNVLNISIAKIIQFIPAFFSILYPPFMFLLAKSISKNNSQALLITFFSFPLIFSKFQLTIHPAFFSFIFLPLLVALYHKRIASQRNIEVSALMIILCFFIVVFHPITTLLCIIIFITFLGLGHLFRKIRAFLDHDDVTKNRLKITGIILILITSFLTWNVLFTYGVTAIKRIYDNLVYGSEWTIATRYLYIQSSASLTFLQTIRLILLQYGAIIIFCLLAIFCLMKIIKKLFFTKKILELEFLYGGQVIVAFIIATAMIFANFIEADTIRVLRYFLMVVPILIGIVIYLSIFKNIKSKIKRKYSAVSIFFIIFFTISLCIFNVYSSPIIWRENMQFTHMGLSGSSWTIEYRDINTQISSDVGFNLVRMEHYINGLKEASIRIKEKDIFTPNHFGYDCNSTVYQAFNNRSTYMITTENGKQAVNAFPENVRLKARQWTENDYHKLKDDRTASKIYSNNELEAWMINNVQ